jgi:uncharacterized protein
LSWKVNVDFRRSDVHGMGVFASKPIPAGSVVWSFDDSMHLCDRKAMGKMSPASIGFALHGGYLHIPSDRFLWYEDGMEFMNHGVGSEANVGLDYWPALGDDHLVALRDIAVGEELLEDYTFCLSGGLAPGHWLRPFYLEHHPDHYRFLLTLQEMRVAA